MKQHASPHSVIAIVARLGLAAALVLTSLSAAPPSAEAIRASVPPAPTLAPPAPGFLTGPMAGAPRDIVLNYFREQGQAQGFAAADLTDLVVTDEVLTQHNGVTHVYLSQRVNGLEVVNAVANANVTRNGAILSAHQTFVPGAAAQAAAALAVGSLSAMQAVERAAEQLRLPTPTLTVRQSLGGKAQAARLSGGGISQNDIPIKLVYYAVKGKTLHLAWDMVIYPAGGEHWWNVQVDAVTGVILGQADWVASEAYNVVPFSTESPNHGPITIAVDPYLSNTVASPYGWHDTDGQAGPEYTVTHGNNVLAQEDWFGDDDDPELGSLPGLQPDGGPSLMFTPTINFSQHPTEYVASAIVNLFYWNNISHDLLYNYGFDEVSGNFQDNTYGRGGTGGDLVHADAQDGFELGESNNANFATPPDGLSGRMQMYVFTGVSDPPQIMVQAPAAISGTYMAGNAEFGAQVALITGTVKLANDGVMTTTDGCEAFSAGFFDNQIALLDRSSCSVTVGVVNAQNAGAIGVIIVDNRAGAVPPFLFGSDLRIFIPVVSVRQSDGVAFKANLPFTAMLVLPPPPVRDSDFDAGIILHEYGHGVSNRLTGGPSAAGCLEATESGGMGEGWSDFLALAFLAQPGDTGPQARGMGTYVLFQPITGPGSRSYPYSTDLGVNPLTYNNMPDTSNEVHAIGEIWAATLWDLHWAYVDRYGFSADMYNGTAGNNQAIRLVLDGMKFQPCNPSFVDGRNALLEADLANTGGRNQALIWQVFARRGLGFRAVSGNLENVYDGLADFSLPPTLGFRLDQLPQLGYPGQVYTYTLLAINQGEAIFSNMVLTAQVPVSATYVAGSASNAGVEANGLIQWNVGTVLTGTSLTRTFQLRVPEALNLPYISLSEPPLNWVGGAGWLRTIVPRDPNRPIWHAFETIGYSRKDLVLGTPITVPIAPSRLMITHRSESDLSGGVIELSTDNGTTWTDLGSRMIHNGYNATADTVGDGSNYVPAFGGYNADYFQTDIDLSTYAGQAILLRFRFFSKASDKSNGWFVDADHMLFGPLPRALTVLAGAQASGNLSATVSAPLVLTSTAVARYVPLPHLKAVLSGQTALTTTLVLTNAGGLPLDFNLSDLPAWLTVSPLSGSVPALSQRLLTVVWDTSAFTVGVMYTGAVTLNSNSFGAPSLQIPLSSVFIGGETTVGPTTNPPLVFTNANGVTTTIEFPTDAVSNSVTVLYRHFLTPVTSTGGLNFAGHAFTLGVLSGTESLETFTFAQPITVTIHYAEAEAAGVFAPGLTLYLWDGDQWVDAATSCPSPRPYVRDVAQRTVSVAICHFTPFALLGPSQQNLYLPLVQR